MLAVSCTNPPARIPSLPHNGLRNHLYQSNPSPSSVYPVSPSRTTGSYGEMHGAVRVFYLSSSAVPIPSPRFHPFVYPTQGSRCRCIRHCLALRLAWDPTPQCTFTPHAKPVPEARMGREATGGRQAHEAQGGGHFRAVLERMSKEQRTGGNALPFATSGCFHTRLITRSINLVPA